MSIDLWFMKQHVNEYNDKIMFNVFICKLIALFLCYVQEKSAYKVLKRHTILIYTCS